MDLGGVTMETLLEIQRRIRERKDFLFPKFGIKALAVFGSFSRSEPNEKSDIDIMVEFEKPIGIEFVDLAEELERILQKKVDLVSRRGIKPKYFQMIQPDLKYV